MNKEKSILAGCLTWGLTVLALLLSFLSYIGRPDSMEEISRGRLFDIIILGPAWGSTIFMHLHTRLKERANGKVIALLIAISAWVLSSSISMVWEHVKVNRRMESLRQMEEQIQNEKPLEQSVPGYPPQGVGSPEP